MAINNYNSAPVKSEVKIASTVSSVLSVNDLWALDPNTNLLESELKLLETRESDDAYLPEIKFLLARLEVLKDDPKLKALESRTNNDAYIEGLRDKEKDLATLEGLKVGAHQFEVALLDKEAIAPESPTNPKPSFILGLSLVLGMFLGGLFSAMLELWSRVRLELAT
jgi:LPS O-antigen subunit length determinant protein (WzzB/FepE family)